MDRNLTIFDLTKLRKEFLNFLFRDSILKLLLIVNMKSILHKFFNIYRKISDKNLPQLFRVWIKSISAGPLGVPSILFNSFARLQLDAIDVVDTNQNNFVDSILVLWMTNFLIKSIIV